MKKWIGLFLLMTTLTMTVQAQEALNTETLIGIGATLEKMPDGTARVDALIPNAPAERAGLPVGAMIVGVQSLPTSALVDVHTLSLTDIVALIRGPLGVPVELTYQISNSELKVLSIVRDKFDVDDGH